MESTFRFTGDDRFIGDYLRSEFLQRVSRADVSFLTRTSILDRMSGPLCDVTAGRTGSSRVLDRLERRNLLVLPLDRRGDWYRYHPLFRELLHAELTRREPDIVPELHSRAAAWYEANDLPESAIEHAQHAGDADRVARLVLKVANPVWASGRLDTVLRWMEWFTANELIETQPAVAVHGALIYALIGRAGDAERWARAAERTTFSGTLADGNTMESTLAYLRALLCRNGVDEMRQDAQVALEGLSSAEPVPGGHAPRSWGRPTCSKVTSTKPTCTSLAPRTRRRVPASCRSSPWPWPSEASSPSSATTGTRPRRCRLRRWRSCGTAASTTTGRAPSSTRGPPTSRPSGETRKRPVSSRDARLDCGRCSPTRSPSSRSRRCSSWPAPTSPSATPEEPAPPCGRSATSISIGRHSATCRLRPLELLSKLETLRGEMLGVSSLTTAELRLLPFLPTHLSLAEISERLFVSRNTVKSQAISIYRKFGVSSRGETISRMHELGLVAHR